ncbi:MAG: hypothetical protein JWP80_2676 [Pseudomonas sp.]|nr:hypothetical protein [Pseudomonas sp.]
MLDPQLSRLIESLERSYKHWTGDSLPGAAPAGMDRAQWLHEHAPYSLVAHDGGADPVFMYTNDYALGCFKYSREEFIAMPSRFSASALDRDERAVLLGVVREKGVAHGYSGYRVNRSGGAFRIQDGSVWELLDEQGQRCGQAALFWFRD